MLRFKQFILEYLTPEEKEKVSTWDKRTPEASKATDHFFGVGNDEHHEPLVNTAEKSEVHRAIEKHIGRDISHEDYKSGMTKDENGKQTRIPQLISDPSLRTQFKTDNSRKNVKANMLSVRTTRSPEGIAGQTSHGQSWENASCKNFNTGCNRHYLPAEVKHGTVVSYLHDHEGKEIARATFQPHINSEGNTVYVRDSYYGTRHPEFERHNREMELRLSMPHRGSNIYTKHREVYDDSGISRVIHPEKRKEYAEELKKKIQAGTYTSDDLYDATGKGYFNDEHERLLPGALTKKLQAGTHTSDDLYHAHRNGYLNDEHRELLPGALTKKIQAGTYTPEDINHAQYHGYLNDEHRELLPGALTKKLQAGTYTSDDLWHAHRHGYLNDEHKKLFLGALTKKIQAGTYTRDDLDHAKDKEYLNDDHWKLLPAGLMKKMQAGTHTRDDLYHARVNDYLNDDHKKLLADALTKKLQAGNYTMDDIADAHRRGLGYLTGDHTRLLDKHLADKIKSGNHTNSDVMYAKDYGYFKEHSQRALANHPKTDGEGQGFLDDISRNSTDPETLKAVANHKNTTARSLGTIARRSNHPEVHKALIDNDKTEDSDLHEISKKSADPEVHKKLLQRGGGVHKPYIINQILRKYTGGYIRPEDEESMANKYVNDALEKKNRWDKQKELEKQQYAKRMQKPVRKSIPQNKPDITVPIKARDKRFGVVESNQGK